MEDLIIDILNAGYYIWNVIADYILGVLVQSPEQFAGGSVWRTISLHIIPFFVLIASSAYTCFLMIGFFQEVSDLKQVKATDFGFTLVKWILGMEIIKNFTKMVVGVLQAAATMTGMVNQSTNIKFELSNEVEQSIRDANWLAQVGLLIIVVVVFLIIVFCSFSLLTLVYQYFIKLILMLPFGVLACSTLPIRNMNMFSGFWKNLIAQALVGVGIVLGLVCASAIINSGFTITSELNLIQEKNVVALVKLCEVAFYMVLCVTCAKAVEGTIRQGLGIS